MSRRKNQIGRTLLVLAWLAAVARPAAAQVSPSLYDYPRPSLDWYTIETEHFQIHFHADSAGSGSGRTARVVARIAEEIYGPITVLYEHEPDTKVSFVLKNFEDYSNGAAYFFDNKIEIWAPSLESPLRGEHNWLRNVITHEFTHIVQVQKTMKRDRRWPALYLQWLGYEDVKRPDVLYGYPNVLVTYPVPAINNPAWLAEGTAQYQRAGLAYDRWDSHRDMLLRTRLLAGEELSLAEMGGFYSHTSLGRESVYNHGYALSHYLAGRFGEDALRKVSEQLARPGNLTVEQAMADAFGVPGGQIHAEWVATLRREYEARTAAIRAALVEGRLVEEEGFANYYPRYSPDGRRLAYVSNRGEDFSLTSLYVRDVRDGSTARYPLEDAAPELFGLTCSQGGERLREGVGGAFGWRPDGGAVVYARVTDTRLGFRYSDLYELDLETKKSRRLTQDARAAAPAYSPDGGRIAFVTQADGTTNLALLDPASGVIEPLTRFRDGTQVSDPAWDPSGAWIYFARSLFAGRDLYRVRPDGSGLEAVLATEADERAPALGADGRHLYFSSDAGGIFDLYRLPVGDSAAGAERVPEQLTRVVGGAFQPSVGPDGRIAYAQYRVDGYKIAELEAPRPLPGDAVARYEPPEITRKTGAAGTGFDWDGLNDFDDTDLGPLGVEGVRAIRTEGEFRPPAEAAPGRAGPEETVPEPAAAGRYRNVFTSFSFFPTLRVDRYDSRAARSLEAGAARRGLAGRLARSAKIGAYVSSREVLEGLSLFGGLLVAPASEDASSLGGFLAPNRLVKLERDLFLQFEYKKGLPWLPYKWSPQFAVEVFGVRRNVEGGLSIEEFPCTACRPDTTYADLAYSLLEGALYVRSKLSRGLLLELGYRYSPYRVRTESFFSRESRSLVPESSARYFIGRTLSFKAYAESLRPHRHGDVVPVGLRAEGGYEYGPGRLLDRFTVEDGLLVPQYRQFRNHRLYADARFGLRVPRGEGAPHGAGVRLRASTILGPEVDGFFNDYVGGLIGARGYPFYALGGNETAWLQLSYTLPLVPRIDRQLLFVYADKLYARLYADAAAAWNGGLPGGSEIRKDVGAELRLGLGSFYLFPTAVFVSGTYGLDRFDFQLDEGFVTPEGRTSVTYGKELLWHFGIVFDFEL